MQDNGRKPTYDLDDILAEAQLRKQERQRQQTAGSATAAPRPLPPTPPAPVKPRPVPPAAPAPVKPRPVPPATEAPQPVPAKGPVVQARVVATPLSPRQEATAPEGQAHRSAAEENTIPLGENIRIFPGPSADRPPPRVVVEPARTPPPPLRPRKAKPPEPECPTKVMEPVGVTPIRSVPVREAAEPEDEDGQLQFEELVEEDEDVGAGDDWEERLREARRDRASRFQLVGDEEELNDPAEEPEEVFEDEEELEDYGSYEETEAVASELTYRQRMGFIGVFLTGLMEVALIGLAVLTFVMRVPPLESYVYLSIHLFLLLVMLLVNHRMVGGGLKAFCCLRADADSAVSLAAVFTLLHTALQYISPDGVAAGKVPILIPVAGFSLFLGAVGKQMRVKRIGDNFRFVSHPGGKYAADRIDDRETAVEMARDAVAIGDPDVVYFRQTDFLTGFLDSSYDEDGTDRAMRVFMPCAFLGSLAAAVGYGLLSGNWWNAATLFTAALCLSAPAAAVTAVNFPLRRVCGKLLRRGAMMTGWRAVRVYGEARVLAVDAADLFPSESILLHGIKTFSGARIDEAIMDAAAVSIAAGGPLSHVFRRVIEDKVDILGDVDTLVYEQDMGLSGWVSGRRVLVGNRRLLENHGVHVPSLDYEARYTRDGRQLVYLSTAGELAAMFVVSFIADEGIADALHRLTRSGLTLLVRTCDPNVTAEKVAEVFDLDEYYVEIMSAASGRIYDRLVEGTTEQEPAVLASNGRIEGMASALAYCRRLHTAAGLAIAALVIGAGLGFALSVFLIFYTGLPLSPLIMLAYLAVWTLITWLMPAFRRV